MPTNKFFEANRRLLIELTVFLLKMLTVLVILTALFFMFTITECNRTKHLQDAHVILCQQRLKYLYSSLQEYAANSKGFYPSRLEELAEPDVTAFICASSHSPRGAIDYYYQPGIKATDKRVRRLLWDKRTNHKEVINILYSDGSIKTEKK